MPQRESAGNHVELPWAQEVAIEASLQESEASVSEF
jgi:hypothetical protein